MGKKKKSYYFMINGDFYAQFYMAEKVAKVARAQKETCKADYTVSRGNVFADLALPVAEKMLADADNAVKEARINRLMDRYEPVLKKLAQT